MNLQLGIESVPQNYVFLRSVGRHFTQVRPRQEMEMKVKNFMPPYATDPEIYLKEGPYTGPNTWSQGEDSGLEESLADSNSQRSHDRATPESLTDDQLILPKVTDLLNRGRDSQTPDELDERRSLETPSRAMAIPMAEDDDDLTTGLTRVSRSFVNGVPDIEKMPMKSSVDGERYRRSRYKKDQPLLDFNELPKDVRTSDTSKNRGGSLNRKQGRMPSKERGGTQMTTWTETRTTRLRRSKALGETKANSNKPFLGRHPPRRTEKKPKTESKPVNKDVEVSNNNAKNGDNNANTNLDAEDEAEEDSGKILMERIRANSRCLRARLSSHTRRHTTDTGASVDYDRIDTRYKTGYNGVYTMHSRRNRVSKQKDETHNDDVQIEDTTIQMLDEKGKIFNMNDDISIVNTDLDMAREGDHAEILHLHTLSIHGVDTRLFEDHIHGIAVDEGRYQESAEHENNDANDLIVQESPTLYTIQPSDEMYKMGNEEGSTPETKKHPDAISEVPSSEEREQEESPPNTQSQEKKAGEEKDIQLQEKAAQSQEKKPMQQQEKKAMPPSEKKTVQSQEKKTMQEKKTTQQKEKKITKPQEKKTADKPESAVSELRQGEHIVNQNNNLTIEVEVKELSNEPAKKKEGTASASEGSPTPAGDSTGESAGGSAGDSAGTPAGDRTDESTDDPTVTDDGTQNSQSQPNLLTFDSSIEYDSYPVYSEQNLPFSSSVEFPVPTPETKFPKHTSRRNGRNRRSQFVKPERSQYSRGIYLRKMEHREKSGSTMRRAMSDGDGLAETAETIEEAGGDAVQHLGQTRRGGMGSFEKWNSTSSTGDLRELPWESVSEKERLLMMLDGIRAETRIREKHREELLRRIKHLQNRAHQRREQGEESTRTDRTDESVNQNRCLRSLPEFARRADSAAVREMWRKRYLEAKKVTPRLEEECSKLRHELEKLHRELLAKVQAGVWALLTISGKTEKPSNKLSYKIMIARLLQEIEDLSRRVEGTRLKLHTEIKLRAMAEKDVRSLREELLKKKIQVTLTRNQEQATMGNGLRQQYFISAV